MIKNPYKFTNKGWKDPNTLFATFNSTGPHGIIQKFAGIYPYSIKELTGEYFNLGFGDLVSDPQTGQLIIDDKVESNNGDIIKIFNTIASLVEEFFIKHPEAIIHIGGSTPQRIKVYCLIISRKWEEIQPFYTIQGYYNGYLEDFNPNTEYLFILINKK